MEPVFVPKTPHDKALQRALMQWRKPQNRKLVLEALHRTGREDLIGYGKHCLIRPDKGQAPQSRTGGEFRSGGRKSSAPPARKGGKPSGDGRKEGFDGRHTAQHSAASKPVRKAGWAKAKPKPNAKGRGKSRSPR